MHTSITMYIVQCTSYYHFALRVYLSVREISASLCKFFMVKIYKQPLRKSMLTAPCMNIYIIHVPSKVKTIKQGTNISSKLAQVSYFISRCKLPYKLKS